MKIHDVENGTEGGQVSNVASKPKIERRKELEHKLVIRTVSAIPQPEMGAFGVDTVDGYITVLLNEGWKIQNTHFLGSSPEGYIFAWILVR